MERLDRLESKVDKLHEVNNEQNITLTKMEVLFTQQQAILDEHVKRSKLNEQHILIVEKTLEKHLQFIRGIIWLAGGLSTLLFAVLGIIVKLLY